MPTKNSADLMQGNEKDSATEASVQTLSTVEPEVVSDIRNSQSVYTFSSPVFLVNIGN